MEIELDKNRTQENNLEKSQNNFLNTTIGKIVNMGINAGIRYLFPNIIENQVIEIKDTLIKEGLKEGIDKAIQETMNIGKSAIGIVTGNFENINQIQTAVGKGGLIESVSKVIDQVIEKGKKEGKLDKNIFNIIKQGKNLILDNISANIEDMLTNQIKAVNKLENYAISWKKYYNQRDFESMEKEYKKIEGEIDKIVPLEKVIKEIREIENMHQLIKNRGGDFNLSWEQIEASKVLV